MFEPCPCASGKGYFACCGRLHGGAPAETAEALMRARYVAFARGHRDFLRASWAPETRPPTIEIDPEMVWTGLVIEEHKPAGKTATVRFAASWTRGREKGVLREVSRFRSDGTTWYYIDGELL